MNRAALLCLILLAGLLLRCYNLNSPSIGYHNMMENQSLCMAQEMLASGDFFHKKPCFENNFAKDTVIRNNVQLPLLTYQIILSRKLFGENLWGARLFNVLFGLASILVVYFMARVLFGNYIMAMGSAAMLAVMPLAVFFSRNLQAESPGFFFMLLGNLFYLRFIKDSKEYNLLLGGASFLIAWLYGFNFIFGALPFLFCFPFRDIAKNKNDALRFFSALLVPFAAALFFYLWSQQGGSGIGPISDRLKPDILSFSYWRQYAPVISWYTRQENFTPVFSILALLGIILAFLKGGGDPDRYIIGWTFCAFIYAAFFSNELHQQNFIQMPFLGLVVISGTYSIGYLSESIKKTVKKDLLVYLLAAALTAGGFLAYNSVRRMHAVLFLGQDVAGESLKEFTKPGERVFLFTYAQGYGIARYAQREVGWTQDLREFKEKEKEFGIRYLCVYPAEFMRSLQNDNPPLFEYIRENYHAKEIGFTDEPNKLFYIILERGKGSDTEKFLDSFAGPKKTRTIYKISGRYLFFYSIRIPDEKEPAAEVKGG